MRTLAPTLRLVEIACDESGYEGENLIGATTDVFAHASVRLSAEEASNCMQELRRLIRSPAQEYKSNHLLRSKHRSVLEWVLGPSGPIHGNARVHLIDKTFFVVGKVVDLVAGAVTSSGPEQGPRARAMAVTLYREGQPTFGRQRWEAFLKSFNDLMRPRNRHGDGTSVDSFFQMVDVLRRDGARGQAAKILGLLGQARPHAEALRAQLRDDPWMIPVMDPLIPAILRAVAYWGDGRNPVAIVHDEHTTLTAERIARLKQIFGAAPAGRLTSLRLVDSRSDSRVQVADLLAGVARRIASDELNDRGDAELTVLLRPYVDPFSIWGDQRSWSVLRPATR
jgi:hypothetical protein